MTMTRFRNSAHVRQDLLAMTALSELLASPAGEEMTLEECLEQVKHAKNKTGKILHSIYFSSELI